MFISFCLLFAVVEGISSLKKLFQEAMAVRKKGSELLPALQVCNMSYACHHFVGFLVYSFDHLKNYKVN
jgi:hypothetical protein